MTMKQLEARLEQLEKEVAELRLQSLPKQKTAEPEKKGWRAWVGMATDDPWMKEAFALAQQYREKSRQEARRPPKRKAKNKR
jgi:hypothetical protein